MKLMYHQCGDKTLYLKIDKFAGELRKKFLLQDYYSGGKLIVCLKTVI